MSGPRRGLVTLFLVTCVLSVTAIVWSVLALTNYGQPPIRPVPEPTSVQSSGKSVVLVEDVQGGTLLCTALGKEIVSCRWFETAYPDVDFEEKH